jgi:hypothetical protein
MNLPYSLCAALLGAIAIAPTAEAFVLNASTGEWSNPVGGAFINYPTVGDETQIRWGDTGTNPQSGLGFLGVEAVDFALDTEFALGRLRHFNFPIATGAPEQVDLTLNLDFADFGLKTFNYTLAIDETTNSAPCAYVSVTPCADRITWTDAIAPEEFDIGGIAYTLELTGFSDGVGGTPVTEFISQEGGQSDAVLFAKLTAVTDSQSVPEPGALLGLVAIATTFSLARSHSGKSS